MSIPEILSQQCVEVNIGDTEAWCFLTCPVAR